MSLYYTLGLQTANLSKQVSLGLPCTHTYMKTRVALSYVVLLQHCWLDALGV